MTDFNHNLNQVIDWEKEIHRLALAMMARNRAIGEDLIINLRLQMTVEEVAGVVLVSLQRILDFDVEAAIWALECLIPGDVMLRVHRLMSVAMSKRLIQHGMVPGIDFSVDSQGKLMLGDKAKAIVSPCYR